MDVKEKATACHNSGLNCAQSVLIANKDYTGLDDDIAAAISSGFGGGVRSGEICGAVSGAVMAIGKHLTDTGHSDMIAAETKRFVSEFREHFGNVRCIELKTNGKYPCSELIEYAAELCESFLKEK